MSRPKSHFAGHKADPRATKLPAVRFLRGVRCQLYRQSRRAFDEGDLKAMEALEAAIHFVEQKLAAMQKAAVKRPKATRFALAYEATGGGQ